MRTTPDNITQLKENEIFVFGSNLSGIHGAGAAKLALDKFGAVYGQGEGIQGQSYAIPTKSIRIKRSLTLDEIVEYIYEFIEFAEFNSQSKFLVTEIGCGLASHSVHNIAPLFRDAMTLENVYLPKRFWEVLNKA